MPSLRSKPQISFLVPFRDSGEQRTQIWAWLERYWKAMFPTDEIVIGQDNGYPFSKAVAVNNAAKKARGRIFVILDADCYMDSKVVQSCANDIDAAVAEKKKLWFVPYLELFRLTEAATKTVLKQDPTRPFDISTPPPAAWVEKGSPTYGHKFGAMILILPATAFKLVGGMDPRFRGWGGEDAAFMKALDTLYALHQTTPNEVLHLWHERPGAGTDPTFSHITRTWQGQTTTNANGRLAQRYGVASGDVAFMKALQAER